MNISTIKGKSLGILLSLALVLSMAAVVLPAQPVHAATINVPGDYATIQAAINAAGASDTIIVAAGTYAENVILNKDITLRSASGSASTIIQPAAGIGIDVQAGGAGCTIGGAINTGFTIIGKTFSIQLTNAPANVLISYNTISTVGTATQGVSVGAAGATGLTVSNNTFIAEVNDGSIWGVIMVGVTVSNNTFTGPGGFVGGYAVEFAGVTGASTISGNTISGYSYGIGILSGSAGGTSGLTVSNNNITGCTNGIAFLQYLAVNITTVTVTGNTLSTNTIGLRVGDGLNVLATNFTIQYNKFTGNTTYGLKNEHATEVVTANGNWWGANDGPDDDLGVINGTGDKISLNVTVASWLRVAVTDPNGGGCIKGGIAYEVKWTSYSVTGAQATISLYNGSTWTDLGQKQGLNNGANTLTVTMPNISSSTCKIKVTISGGGGASYYDESDSNFRLDNGAPSVQLGALSSTCLKGGVATNLTFVALDTGSTSLYYDIEYTTNGSTWTHTEVQFSGAPGSYTRSWTVPSISSNTCKWRVTATDCANNATTATSSTFTIDFTAPTTVTVIQPNGGETLTAGGTYTIQWNAIDNLPGNLNYTLAYSTTGGAPYSNAIAGPFSGAQGTNPYTWTVPNINSTTVRVQVTAADCATNATPDASDANFTIQDTTLPIVTVTSPNGGEQWRAGSSQTITWTGTDLVPGNLTYNLYYCTDYSGSTCTWLPIATIPGQPQGPATYTWTPVPTPLTGLTSNTCRVKVEAADTATTPNTSNDVSDNNFSIIVDSGSAVTVSLTSPSATGITWQGGTCQTITWNATTTVPTDTLTIVLQYSSIGTFPGTTIVTLNNRDLGNGCFCWAVPTGAPTATYKVKITATVTGTALSASDESDNAFTVSVADPDWGITTDSIALKTGWNLMSLQLIPTCCPSSASGLTTTCTCTLPIEGVLASVLDKVDKVWYYNNNGTTATWISYRPGGPIGLTRMEDGKAYWVNVTADCTLTFQGRKSALVVSPPPSYNTVVGWNMVGYKDTGSTRTVQQYLGTPCPSTIYSLPIYEQTTFGSPGWTLKSACTDTLTEGHGYWVYYNSAGTFRALE